MDEILQVLLSEIEGHPDRTVEESIRKVAVDLNMSEDELEEITETFKMLDAFDNKATDLAEKRREGQTRASWVQQQLSALNEGNRNNGDVEAFVSQIEEGVAYALDNTMTQKIVDND